VDRDPVLQSGDPQVASSNSGTSAQYRYGFPPSAKPFLDEQVLTWIEQWERSYSGSRGQVVSVVPTGCTWRSISEAPAERLETSRS
jgi:hypothetical protein